MKRLIITIIKFLLILVLTNSNIFGGDYSSWVERIENKPITSIYSFNTEPQSLSYFKENIYFNIYKNRINSDIFRINVHGGFPEKFLYDVFSEKDISFASMDKYVFVSHEEDSRGDIYFVNRKVASKISTNLGTEEKPQISKNGKFCLYIQGKTKTLILLKINSKFETDYYSIANSVVSAKFYNNNILFTKENSSKLYNYNTETKKVEETNIRLHQCDDFTIKNEHLYYNNKSLSAIVKVGLSNGSVSDTILLDSIQIVGNVTVDNDGNLFTVGKKSTDEYNIYKVSMALLQNRDEQLDDSIQYKYIKQYIEQNRLLTEKVSSILLHFIKQCKNEKITIDAILEYLSYSGCKDFNNCLQLMKVDKKVLLKAFIYYNLNSSESLKTLIGMYKESFEGDDFIALAEQYSQNKLIDIENISNKKSRFEITKALILKQNNLHRFNIIESNNAMMESLLSSFAFKDNLKDFIDKVYISENSLHSLLLSVTSSTMRDALLYKSILDKSNVHMSDFLQNLQKIQSDYFFQQSLSTIIRRKIKNVDDLNAVISAISKKVISDENSNLLSSILEKYKNANVDKSALIIFATTNFKQQIITSQITNIIGSNFVNDPTYSHYYRAYELLNEYLQTKESDKLASSHVEIHKFYNSQRTNIEGLFLLARILEEEAKNIKFDISYDDIITVYNYIEILDRGEYKARLYYSIAKVLQEKKEFIASIAFFKKAMEEKLIFPTSQDEADFYFNIVEISFIIDTYDDSKKFLDILSDLKFVKNSVEYQNKLTLSKIRYHQLKGETELVDNYINSLLNRKNITQYQKAKILLNKSLFNVINEEAQDYESAYESAILSEKQFSGVSEGVSFKDWIKLGVGVPILPVYKMIQIGKAKYNFNRDDEDIIINSIKINYLNSSNQKYKSIDLLHKKLVLAISSNNLLAETNCLNELAYAHLQIGDVAIAKKYFFKIIDKIPTLLEYENGEILQKALKSLYNGLLLTNVSPRETNKILNSISLIKRDKTIRNSEIEMLEGIYLLNANSKISLYQSNFLWEKVLQQIDENDYRLKSSILYLLSCYSTDNSSAYYKTLVDYLHNIHHDFWMNYTNIILGVDVTENCKLFYKNYRDFKPLPPYFNINILSYKIGEEIDRLQRNKEFHRAKLLYEMLTQIKSYETISKINIQFESETEKNMYNMLNNYYKVSYKDKYSELAQAIITKSKNVSTITSSLSWLDRDYAQYIQSISNSIESNTLLLPYSIEKLDTLINDYNYDKFDIYKGVIPDTISEIVLSSDSLLDLNYKDIVLSNSVVDLAKFEENRSISGNSVILFHRDKLDQLENAREVIIAIDSLNSGNILFSTSNSVYLIDIINRLSNNELIKFVNLPITLFSKSVIPRLLSNKNIEEIVLINDNNTYVFGGTSKPFMEKFPSAKNDMITNIKLAQKYESLNSSEYDKLVTKEYKKAKTIMNRLDLNDEFAFEIGLRLANSEFKNGNYVNAIKEIAPIWDSLFYMNSKSNFKECIRSGELLYKSYSNIDSINSAVKILDGLISLTKTYNQSSLSAKYLSKKGFLLLEKKDYNNSIDNFEKASNIYLEINKEDGYFSFQKKIGDIYMENIGDLHRADSVYSKLLNIETIPDKYKYAIYREFSTLKIREGKYIVADSIVNRLKEFKSDSDDNLYNLYKAQISIYLGNMEEFWKSIDSIAIKKDNPLYKFKLIFEIKGLIIANNLELANEKNIELLNLLTENEYSIYLSNEGWINYKLHNDEIAEEKLLQALDYDVMNGSPQDIAVSYKNIITFFSFIKNSKKVAYYTESYLNHFANTPPVGYFDRVIKYHYLLSVSPNEQIKKEYIKYISQSENPCFWRIYFVNNNMQDRHTLDRIKKDKWNRYQGLEFNTNYEDYIATELTKKSNYEQITVEYKELKLFFNVHKNITLTPISFKNNTQVIFDMNKIDFLLTKQNGSYHIDELSNNFQLIKGYNIVPDGEYWEKVKNGSYDSLNVYYPFRKYISNENNSNNENFYKSTIDSIYGTNPLITTSDNHKISDTKIYIEGEGDNIYLVEETLLYSNESLIWFYGENIYGYLLYKKLVENSDMSIDDIITNYTQTTLIRSDKLSKYKVISVK